MHVYTKVIVYGTAPYNYNSMAAGAGDFSAKVLEACEAGEKFVEAFYDTVDKRRNVSRDNVQISMRQLLCALSCWLGCTPTSPWLSGTATRTQAVLK